VELTNALQFSSTSVAQEIVCHSDAITGLGTTLDCLGSRITGRLASECKKSVRTGCRSVQCFWTKASI